MRDGVQLIVRRLGITSAPLCVYPSWCVWAVDEVGRPQCRFEHPGTVEVAVIRAALQAVAR